MRSKEKQHIDHSEKGMLHFQSSQIYKFIKMKKNIPLAKKMVIELLTEYPDDSRLLSLLAQIYIIERDYINAMNILEKCDEEYVYMQLISLYIKLNQQEKLYNLYKKYNLARVLENERFCLETREYHVYTYLQKMFNGTKIDIQNAGYYYRQINNYNEKSAIANIKRKHQTNSKCIFSGFNQSVDIEDLFSKAHAYIEQNKEKAVFDNSITDEYIFYYPQCGIARLKTSNSLIENPTDYFKVCTIVNTANIITMYPSVPKENEPICYLKENENTTSKVKVKSGIERFYNRYGK